MSASLRITVPLIPAYFITVVHHNHFFHSHTSQDHSVPRVSSPKYITFFSEPHMTGPFSHYVCHYQNISQFLCNHSSQDHSVPRPSSPQRITVLSPRVITILPSQGMTPHDPSSTPFPLITADVSASLLISRHPQHPNLGPNEVKP